VARLLRDHGLPVRAFTRTADNRVGALKALGIEVATGDLHDRQSLTAALEDVEVAYFTYPVAAGVVDAAANFASAAREAGLKRLVVMSMCASEPDAPSAFAREYWLAEELLDRPGFSTLHLHVLAFFFENLQLLHRADILGDGVIKNSLPTCPSSGSRGRTPESLQWRRCCSRTASATRRSFLQVDAVDTVMRRSHESWADISVGYCATRSSPGKPGRSGSSHSVPRTAV